MKNGGMNTKKLTARTVFSGSIVHFLTIKHNGQDFVGMQYESWEGQEGNVGTGKVKLRWENSFSIIIWENVQFYTLTPATLPCPPPTPGCCPHENFGFIHCASYLGVFSYQLFSGPNIST